jgi:hypothetical protein
MFIRLMWMLSYPLVLLVLAAFILPRSDVAGISLGFAFVTGLVVLTAQALARRLPITHCSGLSR